MARAFLVRVKTALSVSVMVALAAAGVAAQDIDIGAGGADTVWRGPVPQGQAGFWLDQGAVSAGDNRRDLIIGAPGSGAVGTVYVLYGGPVRTGNQNLNTADVIINGASVGDQFGYSTAAGNILNTEGAIPRNLVVGSPGAGGSNRGRVFLFAGGWGANERLDTTNAVLVITGAPGDRIGAALGTADLNNDGYREIVIGAPGNDRVYVINGGPGLAGTWDLAATPANTTVGAEGTGLGGVITAGDVTGDNISDILLGTPDTNRVFLIRGKTGGVPALISLPSQADAIFQGTDTGDRAGQSIRIADVDGDGSRDILIGASAADGPANSRADSGEVYMFFGSAAFTASLPRTINLSTADVTFFGTTAGLFTGTGMSSGDINRDLPNDIVILAPGGPSSTAELYVYYGRSRSLMGVVNGSGLREVDFNVAGQVDRRVLGDPTIGAISSSQVFEVTGEGARDIIAGVGATDVNAGAVYFTISPKMTLNTSSVSGVVTQGMTMARAAQVLNSSSIGITWQASSNRPWLSGAPASGSAVNTASGALNVTVNSTGLAVGTHTGTLTVSSTSKHLEMALTIAVTVKVAPTTRVASDFDGDGRADLIFRDSLTGDLIGWMMNGINRVDATYLNPQQVTDLGWTIVGTGDFNGDRNPDIVWHRPTSGNMAVWMMSGLTMVQEVALPSLPSPWKVAAVTDINNDGKPDLIIQNFADGFIAAWLMNGTTLIDGQMLVPNQVPDVHWKAVAGGDFNNDNKNDLIWQHQTTGALAVWFQNGVNRLDVQYLNPSAVPDTNWKIKGAADLNGDGKVELLWQHTNSTLAAWFMNGVNQTSAVLLNPSSSGSANLKLVGPR